MTKGDQPTTPKAPVVDLMVALRDSINAAKARTQASLAARRETQRKVEGENTNEIQHDG